MGTWNNLQEGFTVNERLPDTLVDVAVCNVYFSVVNIHRQKEQINKPSTDDVADGVALSHSQVKCTVS